MNQEKVLFNCPACSAQISREAENCPHCGHPVKIHKNRSSLIIKLLVIIAAVYVIYSAYESTTKSNEAANKAADTFGQPIGQQNSK
ncbi:MAG TPA: zinc ribbon domain-containing protein [Verrucomicrobiae bacterium]|nr:zinc ribbon domain-containing protein [Verrucomicrobiae bacterium]